MVKRSKAQEDALKALENPKVIEEYDDGSIDFEFEGQKLAMGPNGNVLTPAEYMSKVYKPWQDKQKKAKAKKPSIPSMPSLGYATGTPCERKPELCTPRFIKHVAWDADDTIWDIKPYGIASNITGPLRLIDPDTVVEERPPYQPLPIKTTAQPTSEPYDEGLRYKYGYRYGSKFGHPEEEPEDFFLRQIDKDIDKEIPSETALEVDEIVNVLTEELSQKEKDTLGLAGQDVKLTTTSVSPPKIPAKKAKTTYGEPTKIYIKLMPGYRDLLDTLKEQGVTNSIISLNTEGTVKRIIDKFGLTDRYLEIRDSWGNKGTVYKEQMKTFGYNTKEGIFVDDNLGNVEVVAKSGAIALRYGVDIKEVAQIMRYMTNA
ncbi:hypothetical protein LCGC14_0854170 [marine sediment metagenome]|uniref:Uncharacterized protein n=1 Tax=marine sediment metagenome TaxID=412755 RepID=A0A0F9PE73_9ZZZZ